MTDLTAAVEAAAATLHRAAVASMTEPDQAPSWDELPTMIKHECREYLLPAVVAAAPILRAQVLAEVADLAQSWPFGRDEHLWQGHERRDFARWLREQAAVPDALGASS